MDPDQLNKVSADANTVADKQEELEEAENTPVNEEATAEETPVSEVEGEVVVSENTVQDQVQVQENTQAEETEITTSQDTPRDDVIASETKQSTEKTSDSQPITDTDEVDTNPVTSGGAALEERGSGKKALRGHIVINKLDVPDAHWYVVHTTSGHEARIAESLRQRIETMGLTDYVFELLIPTQDRVVIRGGKKYTVKEKIFPGYLLVKMVLTDEAWLAVRTTQGITGFVGAGTKPSPLSESEVQNIQKFVAAPAARYKVRFSVGEAVKITDGPFSQFLGTINEMDEARGKVKVLVSIFGRETPVELDFLQIAKV